MFVFKLNQHVVPYYGNRIYDEFNALCDKNRKKVEEGDGLPTIICVPCNQLLDASYDFKRRIQSSDEKLRQILKLQSSKEDCLTSASIVKAIIADVISSVISLKHEILDEGVHKNIGNHSQDNTESPRISVEPLNDICYETKIGVKAHSGDNIPSSRFQNLYNENNESLEVASPIKVEEVSIEGDNDDEREKLKDELEEVSNQMNVFFKQEIQSDIDETCQEERLEDKSVDDEEKPLIWRTSRLRCTQCIKSFSTKLALQRHAIVHKRKTKLRYVCYVCDKQYSTVAKLKNHVNVCHDSKRNRQQSNELAEEKRVGRKSKNCESVEEKRNFKFVCKVCSKEFTYRKSFVTHAKSHSVYKSEPQNQQLEKNVTEDIAHNQSGRDEDGDMDGDGESAQTVEGDVKEEEEEAEEEDEEEDEELPTENLQCTQCGKLFATKRNLKRHVSTHSGLKYNCGTCGKGFSRVDKLKDHEQSKHKAEMFESSDQEDKEDTDNVHKGDCLTSRKKDRQNRPHKCALCPKSFAQAQSLANHMERHKRVKETQKRFLCEVCSKCFAQSGSLVAHMRTHTGVKPYVCNVCSRAFTKSTYLQLHLRTHSGEKPYICQYCSRAFARANTLARHITMHTGEAKYHCQICTKSFRRLTSLNEHTYTHTGQRPYACKICTKRYNNAGSLYAHRKKCKAQQLTSTGFAVAVENPTQQVEGNVPQVLIYSQRKLVEDATVGEVTPTPQYMIANIHNQKSLPTNIIQPFAVEEPNVYSINSKQFKNPYYTIYPNM